MAKRRNNGMGTLISKGEGKPFLAKWVFEGKVYYQSTGEVNRKKAEKVLEKLTRPFREDNKLAVLHNLENKVKDVENEIAEREKKLPGIYIKDIEDRYVNSLHAKDISANTLDLYVKYIKRFAGWVEKEHKEISEMRDVSKKVAEEYMCYVADNMSSAAFNNILVLMKRLWKIFEVDGKYDVNVFDGIKPRRGDASKRRELNSEELYKVFDYIKEDEELLCLFAVGIYTGLRIGDCCKLKWGDVDLFKRTISVVPEKTRKYTGRLTIPMHNSLFNVLSVRWEKKGDDVYVMPNMLKLYMSNAISTKIANIFKNCGIETVEVVDGKRKLVCGFHSLRHTFVSMNLNSGMNPMLVQNIVGHKSVDMTRHYFHSNEGVVRSGIEKMPDLLGCEGYVDMNIKDSDVDLLKSMYDKEKDGSLSDTIKRLVEYYKEYSGIIDIAG